MCTCVVGVVIVGVGGSQNPLSTPEYIHLLELSTIVPRQNCLGGGTGASQSDLKDFLVQDLHCYFFNYFHYLSSLMRRRLFWNVDDTNFFPFTIVTSCCLMTGPSAW